LCDDKTTSDYFLATATYTKNYKAIVNWLTGPIRQYLNDSGTSMASLAIAPVTLASLIALIDEGKVNFSIASSKIFPVLLKENKQPLQIAEELNLLQVSDSNDLEAWVNEAISKMPDKVTEYKKGKKGLIGLFVGEVKKISKGKADPKVVTALLQEKLG
jgi:aspartyl-tRNA(Asn)/glutamyl-tRNA(Gln) amidotransferase subunit B